MSEIVKILKICVKDEAALKLFELSTKNKRTLDKEAEVIILRALGLWEETLPPNNIKLDKEENER